MAVSPAPSNLDYDQFDTAHDFHYDGDRARAYMICSTPRSGSHYLGHLMYSTGEMGYPLEYFHSSHFKRWKELSGTQEVAGAINYIRSRRTSPNGYFGFKAHFAQFRELASQIDFDATFPDCKFILIEREDLLAQAVSYVRAIQTDQWASVRKQKREASYDFAAIHKALLELLEEKLSWSRFFASCAIRHLTIRYEDIAMEPAKGIELITKHLEVGSAQIDEERVLTKKQANSESEEWKRRFVEEARVKGREYLLERARIVQTMGRKELLWELLRRVCL